MKASAIKQELIDNFKVKLPAFIWGSPGIGKTALINQTTKELEIGCVTLITASRDPIDLSGLPGTDKQARTTYWNRPEELPTVERDGEYGILFLDELTSAPPLMQTVCYRLVQEGIVGDYQLPPGWVCVAAGNLSTDDAVSFRQSSALASRFGHYDMTVDVKEWIIWGRANGISEDILAFIWWKPDALLAMDLEEEEHSFPTPRTWEYVNRHYPFMTPENEFDKVRAFVGQATAIEFNGFMRVIRDLPTIEEILANPTGARVSDQPDINNATISLLTTHVDHDNLETLMKYCYRLPAEFQATFTYNYCAKDETLAMTQPFVEWAKDNSARLRA